MHTIEPVRTLRGIAVLSNNQMIGADIAFDANGNLTSKPGATFTWDMKNRLQAFSNGTDTQASYTYDPFGRRIKKTVTTGSTTTTTYFLWDGDQMIAEYNGSGALTKRYAYLGGYAPAQVADVNGATETICDVHTDHLDTPKFLTDQTGTVVWRARHEAYGEAIVNENPDGDSTSVTFNLRFPGQYYDAESGLHYNRFRYYDTTMGRYISADPIGQAGNVNLYGYVYGNPVMFIDPWGLFDTPAYTKWMDDHAQSDSGGQCAKAVRKGLEAGGADTKGHPIAAKEYGDTLLKNGFTEVSAKDYKPEPGDTVIYQPYSGGSPYGHIQTYTEDGWKSDFSQKNMLPNQKYSDSSYKIYRPPKE